MDWAEIRSCITDSIAHGSNYQPKHQNIRELITRHSLQRPVYVGDTDSDRKQAELVPLPFIFVDYGFGTALKFSLRISSFSELVAKVSVFDSRC
jgi:phosphoglycolate phosphatase